VPEFHYDWAWELPSAGRQPMTNVGVVLPVFIFFDEGKRVRWGINFMVDKPFCQRKGIITGRFVFGRNKGTSWRFSPGPHRARKPVRLSKPPMVSSRVLRRSGQGTLGRSVQRAWLNGCPQECRAQSPVPKIFDIGAVNEAAFSKTFSAEFGRREINPSRERATHVVGVSGSASPVGLDARARAHRARKPPAGYSSKIKVFRTAQQLHGRKSVLSSAKKLFA